MSTDNKPAAERFGQQEETQIITQINRELAAAKKLPDDVRHAKNEDIKAMIRYYDDLTKTIEDRRARMAESTWQSIGLFVTALGVIASLPIIALIKILLLLLLLAMVVISFIKLSEFQAQSAFRYPFLKFPEYGNKWKWFYYGNEQVTKINEDPRGAINTIEEDRLHYLRGLGVFLNRYVLETEQNEIADNITQLYLLQVHNYYKNRFYLRLLRYDLWVPKVLLGLLIAYAIIVVIALFSYPATRDFLLQKTF